MSAQRVTPRAALESRLETVPACSHVHSRHHQHVPEGRMLPLAFVATLIIFTVESLSGIASHSLALLSDAGHVLTDLFAIGLAWYAVRRAQQPASQTHTYGYRRIPVLAAQINAITLIVIVAVIGWEAIGRLQHPSSISPALMFVAAGVGLTANLVIGLALHRDGAHSINTRAVMVHVLGDAAASAGVMVAGVLIAVTGRTMIDPILSLVIAVIIARSAWKILSETTTILMEGTPLGLDLDALIRAVRLVPGVRDVHDLHVWSLDSERHALSAHLCVDNQPLSSLDDVRLIVVDLLHHEFSVEHTTLQFESLSCGENGLFCGGRTAQRYSPLPASGDIHGAGDE